ncbi:replication protein RepA [Pseudonocardia nematodicida]|uniref:Replication protein RepA n=1 Tax=Pseudonocardia nematodicida TaxID=1206997 RepID=A0ABV1KFE5_9PSEU
MAGTPSRDLRLLRAAAELWDQDEQEIGFLARLFTQTSLPYRDPGDKPRWERRNGDLTLSVRPGSTGYPYGAMPRLLLNWLSTEALRTKSRDLVLGRNLSDFMRQLGLTPTGGKNGTITRLMKQSDRLFQASLAVRWEGEHRVAGGQMNVASEYNLWSRPSDDPEAHTLFPSVVRLSGDFFDEVTNHPVPIDLGALRALRGSALRLDIYCWLTYRMSYLRRPSTVSWETLRAQFGSELADTKQGRGQFRRDFAKHLREVLLVYRDANVETTEVGVTLSPSRTHVPFKGLRDIARSPYELQSPKDQILGIGGGLAAP